MSTPIPGVAYAYNRAELTWDAFGRPSLPANVSTFSLGQTQPDFDGVVSGVPASDVDSLVNYPDHLTPRTIYIDTPNATLEGYNMGNVRVRVRSTGFKLGYCQWDVTNNRTNEPMISFDNSAVRNAEVSFFTIRNHDQLGYNFNAIQGHDFLAYRGVIMGTVDGIRPNLGGDWAIHAMAIGYLGWWGGDATTPALNSGYQTHSDCVQTTYGDGEIIGSLLAGYVSETVGTGTPNSGSNTGATGMWYTQAEAEARRAAALTQTAAANKSYDGVAHKLNGYVTPLMCTRDVSSPVGLDLRVWDNWIAGGGLQVNALNANLGSPLGSFYRNRHYNDSGSRVGGNGIGYRVRTDLPIDVPQTGPNVNTYMDGAGVVPVSRP